MNRRNFLLGGGFFGILAAGVTAFKKAMAPPMAMVPCDGHHEPAEEYLKNPLFRMGQTDETMRDFIPCRKCGILFALSSPKRSC